MHGILYSLINSSVFKGNLKSEQQQNGKPPAENQNTPFTLNWIDWETDTSPVCEHVTAERQLGHISTSVVRCFKVLVSAACYLLMKAKYLLKGRVSMY